MHSDSTLQPTIRAGRIAVTVLAGVVLWIAASALGGAREAWDSSAYWMLAYPAALFASGLLGYAFPDRPWQWPAALFFGQFIGMCIRNGELGNLWPLGIAVFAVLSLPGIFIARRAARWSLR